MESGVEKGILLRNLYFKKDLVFYRIIDVQLNKKETKWIPLEVRKDHSLAGYKCYFPHKLQEVLPGIRICSSAVEVDTRPLHVQVNEAISSNRTTPLKGIVLVDEEKWCNDVKGIYTSYRNNNFYSVGLNGPPEALKIQPGSKLPFLGKVSELAGSPPVFYQGRFVVPAGLDPWDLRKTISDMKRDALSFESKLTLYDHLMAVMSKTLICVAPKLVQIANKNSLSFCELAISDETRFHTGNEVRLHHDAPEYERKEKFHIHGEYSTFLTENGVPATDSVELVLQKLKSVIDFTCLTTSANLRLLSENMALICQRLDNKFKIRPFGAVVSGTKFTEVNETPVEGYSISDYSSDFSVEVSFFISCIVQSRLVAPYKGLIIPSEEINDEILSSIENGRKVGVDMSLIDTWSTVCHKCNFLTFIKKFHILLDVKTLPSLYHALPIKVRVWVTNGRNLAFGRGGQPKGG